MRERNMVNEKVVKEFKIFRNKLIEEIYLQQYMEWLALTTSSSSDILSDIIVASTERVKKLECSQKFRNILDEIINNPINFDNDIYCEAKIINKRIKDNTKIYSRQLCNALLNVKRNYILAKQKNDFQIVKPFLQTFIKIKLKEEGVSNYESILSKKIVEISSQQVTELFKSIKYNIPLLIATEEKVKYTNCSKEDMDKILDYLIDLVNLNERSLEIYKGDESFMVSFGTNDVKISLNYKEKNMFEFITKSCHELGHALYEQGNNKNHNRTFLSGAASTTMHEAIAIFFEKFIGKNYLLQDFISNELLDKPECFYFTSAPTPIRINASEKNYPIHILIRYEMEKGLLDGELKVNEIEKIWKEKYKEYLGIDIKNSNEGILQDPHWFNDKFAYFPSYIVGRAYAAQLKNEIDKFMAVDEMIKINDLSSLNNWLKENIYQYGAQYGPSELLKKSTKEELNCNYYLDSLHLER